MKIEIKGKEIEINHCRGQCPYFGLDGGPSPVMCCEHPKIVELDKKYKNLNNYGYIISHPQCDKGFPDLCPVANPDAIEKEYKKEMEDEKAIKDMDTELSSI